MDSFNGLKRPIRIKIITMGNAGVGKSCLIKRYCEKRFIPKYLATIGIDYGICRVNLDNKDLRVNIFDMAGHDIFYEVRNEFYKETQGAILMYDVSDRSSFECLDSWLEEMRYEMGNPNLMDNIVFIVCGNKIDLRRQVEEADGRYWAESQGFQYIETSALTGEGVADIFQALFYGVVQTIESGNRPIAVKNPCSYTKEQIEAIYRLKTNKDNYERLGLKPAASKDDINKAYRRLAVLLHPDKSMAPGSEDAFKALVAAKAALLKNFP